MSVQEADPTAGNPGWRPPTVVLLVVVVLAVLGAGWWLLRPPGGGPPSVTVEVPPGASVRAIGSALEQAGLVRSPTVFVLVARAMGAERQLRAGRYELASGLRPWELVRTLREGVIELHQVTIPEGLTIWETASLLQREAAVDSAAFTRLATDSLLTASLGVPSINLEGYLCPDTYDVPLEQSPAELVPMLVARTQRIVEEGLAARPATPLGAAEVVTLASIVEAEARVAAEQPRIAAVYLNRLKSGWRLEADPTVLYALGERRRLFYKDLEIDSPWNTYRVYGLPPTPICSPGRGAIEAVLAPEPDCDAFYFVAQDDGTHRFSRTLAEHERATREIRRARRSARQP
jgi:UPF0755 protein